MFAITELNELYRLLSRSQSSNFFMLSFGHEKEAQTKT